jgi:hypothetical protein
VGRFYAVVEGQGEELAVPNLLCRLSADLGREDATWMVVGRRNAMKKRSVVEAQCEDLRRRGDCDGALLLQDGEDDCPREDGPRIASWVAEQRLPFPVAITLFYREYETLFLACLSSLAGKSLVDPRGRALHPIDPAATFDGDPQRPRDAKGALNRFFPAKHPYRPTTHQLALTRALDLAALRASALPCFGTLERSLRFVLVTRDGGVYPSPVP